MSKSYKNTEKENNNFEEIRKDIGFLEWAIQQEQPNAIAFFFLGSNYLNGENGVKKDVAKAIQLFKRAAELGYAEAAGFVGIAYRDGEGVPQDYSEAVKWFKLAAENGNEEAMYSLYLRYRLGQGVPQDEAIAREWLLKAAECNHAISQRILGELYFYGDLGLPVDKRLAFEYSLKSAKQNDAEAAYCVGLAFLEGEVVEKNDCTAIHWLRIAAKQDYTAAQLDLARSLLCKGDESSFEEALRWLSRGAELGNEDCQYGLELLQDMREQGISWHDI